MVTNTAVNAGQQRSHRGTIPAPQGEHFSSPRDYGHPAAKSLSHLFLPNLAGENHPMAPMMCMSLKPVILRAEAIWLLCLPCNVDSSWQGLNISKK